MRKELERRIQKLERGRGEELPAKMRVFVAKHGGSLEAHLRAVKGHEAELNPEMGWDGLITWAGFLLLCRLLNTQGPAGGRSNTL
jgi:hypothetical protein